MTTVVRFKKTGKRFEVICYKNKVVPWRQNVENNIHEVLETQTVFTNVSKGHVATKDELLDAFGVEDEIEICKEILTKGELEISEAERHKPKEHFHNIAANIAHLCVNPETKRPYQVSVIEQSLKELHFTVKKNKNIKEQTWEAIKMLQKIMPLMRARLEFPIYYQPGCNLEEIISKFAVAVEKQDFHGSTKILNILVEPGNYKKIIRIITKEKNLTSHFLPKVKELKERDDVF